MINNNNNNWKNRNNKPNTLPYNSRVWGNEKKHMLLNEFDDDEIDYEDDNIESDDSYNLENPEDNDDVESEDESVDLSNNGNIENAKSNTGLKGKTKKLKKHSKKKHKRVVPSSKISKLRAKKKPFNIANNVKKITGKIKGVKSLLNLKNIFLFFKNPIFSIIFVVLLIFFFILIFSISFEMFASASNSSSNRGNGIASTSCEYAYGSDEANMTTLTDADEIMVELVNCDATAGSYEVLETVPFEKYILGVALAEIGTDAPTEALKAQMIMVRNFSLYRNKSMCPSGPSSCFYGLNESTGVVRLRACENDQVYWDYTKDIYRVDKGAVSLYSPEIDKNTSNAELWKTALSESEQAKYEAIAQDVAGKLVLDANGNVANLNYTNTESTQARNLANQGHDYTEILISMYPSAAKVSSNSCTTVNAPVLAGDYANWKQCNSAWGDKIIGDRSMCEIGCAVTSLSIVLARSGVETTFGEINPGTFLDAYKKVGGFDGNSIYWDKINQVTANNDLYYDDSSSRFGTFTDEQKKTNIKEMIEDGCYVVMQVKSGGSGDTHFVVIDDIATKESNYSNYYIWDSSSKEGNDLFTKYSRSKKWGGTYRCYRKGVQS